MQNGALKAPLTWIAIKLLTLAALRVLVRAALVLALLTRLIAVFLVLVRVGRTALIVVVLILHWKCSWDVTAMIIIAFGEANTFFPGEFLKRTGRFYMAAMQSLRLRFPYAVFFA